MQQQQRQPSPAKEPVQAAVVAGGMLSSVSSWLSRTTQWASSSSSSSQQVADSNAADKPQADGDSHAAHGCPLCAQEQQQQQAAAADAAPSDSSPAAASLPADSPPSSSTPSAACFIPNNPQQAWRDPFSWRRLVWGLLGRLKPTAQAWYVQHYGMCPHCPDQQLWSAVARSLRRHLWVPQSADALQWQLSGPYVLPHCRDKEGQMLQYARALNLAFQVRVWANNVGVQDLVFCCFATAGIVGQCVCHTISIPLWC
jgi:hypothetical protein